MSVARVTEISVISPTSFDDAVKEGISRVTKTLRNVRAAWVKDQRVLIVDNRITGWEVHLLVTFVLEDGENAGS